MFEVSLYFLLVTGMKGGGFAIGADRLPRNYFNGLIFRGLIPPTEGKIKGTKEDERGARPTLGL